MAKRFSLAVIVLCLVVLALGLAGTGCARKSAAAPAPSTTFGSTIVESSGGKQIGAAGAVLPQPWVLQVNDDQGNAVAGAVVYFSGPAGVNFDPPRGLTVARIRDCGISQDPKNHS